MRNGEVVFNKLLVKYFKKLYKLKKASRLNRRFKKKVFKNCGLRPVCYDELRLILAKTGKSPVCGRLRSYSKKGPEHVIGLCSLKMEMGLEGSDAICYSDYPIDNDGECDYAKYHFRMNSDVSPDFPIRLGAPNLMHFPWKDYVVSSYIWLDENSKIHRVNVHDIVKLDANGRIKRSRIEKRHGKNIRRHVRGIERKFSQKLGDISNGWNEGDVFIDKEKFLRKIYVRH